MKTLPLLTSFALVSALTACTTIRSVEITPVPTAPVTPVSNSQTTNSGTNPAPAIPATSTSMPVAPVTNPDSKTGVSEPSSMPVPPAPVKSTPTSGASMPVPPSTNPTQPASVPPAPQAKIETFSKTMSYSSPGGQDEVTFSVETKDGIITSLAVTPKGSNPVSINYQKNFASKAPAQVVGKSLKGLKVSTVSGASLTTWAFNEFVAEL